LTDDLTRIGFCKNEKIQRTIVIISEVYIWEYILETLCDSTLATIWLKLEFHFVPDENSDAIHSHLSGKVREQFCTIFKLYFEEGVWKGFDNIANNARFILLLHISSVGRV